MINSIKTITTRFARDEDGIALTEYLILLGLLTAAVIGAVIAFGGGLADSWGTWATWMESGDLDYEAPSGG